MVGWRVLVDDAHGKVACTHSNHLLEAYAAGVLLVDAYGNVLLDAYANVLVDARGDVLLCTSEQP